MSSKFAGELIEKLNNFEVSEERQKYWNENYGYSDVNILFFHGKIEYEFDEANNRALLTETLGVDKLKEVDQHGGEGEGSDYWTVYSFTRGTETVYLKFQGWYASYDGATFEEVFEVTPREEIITVYKEV